MSNDRHQDEQLSAAYQSMARERTPEHLDQKVLRMAKANAERPQYSRWIAWSRPLAWAATVALCLAITLEVTQVTTPDNVATETAPEEDSSAAAMIAPELQKDKQEQTSKTSNSMTDAISAEKHSPARSVATEFSSGPAPAVQLRQSADFAEAQSMEEDKETSELGREYGPTAAGRASSMALAADMPVNECAEEIRLEPGSWLKCIIALEAAGDAEAATRQRENLIEVFPDFKLP